MVNISLPHDHHEHTAEALQQLPSVKDFSNLADLFKLLGDPTRLRLFWLLCHCEECVLNLSAIMEMSSPALSHHLRILKASNLITSRRDGKEVYYKASEDPRAHTLHESMKAMAQLSCPQEHCIGK